MSEQIAGPDLKPRPSQQIAGPFKADWRRSGGNSRPPFSGQTRVNAHMIQVGSEPQAMPQSVETRLGAIEGKLLWLAGGIGASFLALLAIIGSGNDKLGVRIDSIDTRLRVVEQTQIEMKGDMKVMDTKLDAIIKRLDERLPAKQ